MLTPTELDRTSRLKGSKDQFVAKMTELFIEGLFLDPEDQKHSSPLRREKSAAKETSKLISIGLPDPYAEYNDLVVNVAAAQHLQLFHKELPADCEDDQYKSVERFIRDLSHYFNNLLMGIWGNASLITLIMAHDHPICARVAQMERLIQTGSNLTHVIFGYLVERKMVTKRLRLVQLIHEINECIQSYGGLMDIDKIEASMQWATRIRCPSLIAGRIARVLEQLFEGINGHYQSILMEADGQEEITKRLTSIDGLLAKGFHMTKQLKFYAGEAVTNPRCLNLNSLAERLAGRTRREHKHIAVRCFLTKSSSSIRADRSQLSFVIEQMIDNAVQSMPEAGKLTIKVLPLIEEAPQDRCVVHMGRDYLVVTIADTGTGMDNQCQTRIFDPFFAARHNNGRMGLGLASATGIVKAHGGYIQVRSVPGAGTTFKIYLPTD